MYAWLRKRVGRRVATALMGLWYAVLLVLILILASETSVNFRYDDL